MKLRRELKKNGELMVGTTEGNQENGELMVETTEGNQENGELATVKEIRVLTFRVLALR